jgi:phenylacetate-CoA ligase
MPYFDRATETMPRDQLRSLQLNRLQSMLAQVYGRNRFYTARFNSAGLKPKDVQSLEDLNLLPMTTKDELVWAQAEDPPFGTNATFSESAYTRVHQTSGTTGVPLRVIDTEESWAWWGKCWGYILSGAGLTADDRLLIPFSFGPFIGFWAAVEGAKEIGALMIPGGGRDSIQRLHLLFELGATAMCCTPTYALRLTEVAREAGIDLRESPVRITVHAGEPGANIPATKARIEKAWGVKCFDHAGASEVGAHSFECELQPGGNHIIESEFIVQVVDPETESEVPPGQMGELVITNLNRIGFPVIRYRTGDLVKLNLEPCDCGRTFARFQGGILGRADDMVVVRGVNVFPSAIENLIRQFDPVDEYQVRLVPHREMYELEIRLELAQEADLIATQLAIENTISESLGLRPAISVVPHGSLPRFELKAKRFSVEA